MATIGLMAGTRNLDIRVTAHVEVFMDDEHAFALMMSARQAVLDVLRSSGLTVDVDAEVVLPIGTIGPTKSAG